MFIKTIFLQDRFKKKKIYNFLSDLRKNVRNYVKKIIEINCTKKNSRKNLQNFFFSLTENFLLKEIFIKKSLYSKAGKNIIKKIIFKKIFSSYKS